VGALDKSRPPQAPDKIPLLTGKAQESPKRVNGIHFPPSKEENIPSTTNK
jgi:hypothetical protein